MNVDTRQQQTTTNEKQARDKKANNKFLKGEAYDHKCHRTGHPCLPRRSQQTCRPTRGRRHRCWRWRRRSSPERRREAWRTWLMIITALGNLLCFTTGAPSSAYPLRAHETLDGLTQHHTPAAAAAAAATSVRGVVCCVAFRELGVR